MFGRATLVDVVERGGRTGRRHCGRRFHWDSNKKVEEEEEEERRGEAEIA